MSFPVAFLPEARAEFDEAADWYDQQRAGLGADFIARVQQVLDRIAANPEIHQAVYRDARRGVVKRFPYSVVYRIEAGQVLVISVFHGKRDPSIWQGRVPDN